MTICPKCREIARNIALVEKAESGDNQAGWAAARIADKLLTLSIHPQDAEVREGLAKQICALFDQGDPEKIIGSKDAPHSGDCLKEPWSCPRCSADDVLSASDAILAYLHQQGFRRIREGKR